MSELIQNLRLWLSRRRHAYAQTFKGPLALVVLKDLAAFCRAHESTLDDSQKLQDGYEGRREVWLRIQHHLRLTEDQLWALYDGREV